MAEVVSYLRENVGGVIVAAVFAFFLLSAATNTYGAVVWYFLTILAALAFAFVGGGHLYAYAFGLGMVTAFAEIIGKFSDEPLKALRSPHALFYHLLNGGLAAFALKVMVLYQVPMTTPLDQLKAVVVAGLGSMLIMRSKLFNIKIGAEDVSFGPEQIIKVFFRYMQEAIDRVRAQSRMEFVKTRMDNVDFVKVYDYSLTMLDSSQVLEKDELDALKTDIDKIKDGTPNDAQLKSYKLGFILQKRMGEDFVNKLFEGNASRDWMIRAPVAETKKDEGGLGTRLSSLLSKKEEYVSYFAYGSSMSTKRFSERLGWDAAYVTQWIATTQPRKCELKGYRLAFNKPDDANPQAGTANIVRDANGTVEGVLYQLTPAALDFLDRSEKGYRRESVKVTLGSEIEALSYVAITTKEGLKPTPEYFEQVLHGGREHGLSDAYLDSLQAIVEEPLRRAAGKPV